MTGSGATTSRTWTILVLVAIPLLLLPVGVFWSMARQTHKAGDEVVAEARALTAQRRIRPSHVDAPTPGTFAQAIEPLVPELLRLQEGEPTPGEPVSEACQDVREGKQPLTKLPHECREMLERGRPLMRRALLASRTEEAGLPEGLQALSDPNHPHANGQLALHSVLKLAALEMRFQLQEGRADTALETCLDGLGLARDMAHGGGVIGAMFSVSGYGTLFQPCADALHLASPTGKGKAAVALRRIREGLSPLSLALREERVFGALCTFGLLLDREQLDALPPGARSIPSLGTHYMFYPGSALPLWGPFLRRHAGLELMRVAARSISLADLPASARSSRLEGLGKSFERSWNPILRESAPDYENFAARVDRQRAQVDLLLAMALVETHRAERGTWPPALPPLYPEHEVLLPTALKLQPDEDGKLLLTPEDASLQELALTVAP
ncbi:hypothetical protein JRI60_13470 [Archangium violaceum]|uniref:hypothetical protein n=1 Tax=Archangium violaceum TaxID=83451 RepID=UPI001951172A|nr:hypothetical protein [Archangium violaceum]QRN99960.1 hypothetical protein JRI60_13470 [Archangium violaceum]